MRKLNSPARPHSPRLARLMAFRGLVRQSNLDVGNRPRYRERLLGAMRGNPDCMMLALRRLRDRETLAQISSWQLDPEEEKAIARYGPPELRSALHMEQVSIDTLRILRGDGNPCIQGRAEHEYLRRFNGCWPPDYRECAPVRNSAGFVSSRLPKNQRRDL